MGISDSTNLINNWIVHDVDSSGLFHTKVGEYAILDTHAEQAD